MADFAGADLFTQALFGQIPTWHDLRIESCERAIETTHLFQARMSFVAQNVPTGAVAVLVKREILRQGVQREMWRGKSQIQKERMVRLLRMVFGKHVDGVSGDGGRRVIITPRLNRRQRLIIPCMLFGIEVTI